MRTLMVYRYGDGEASNDIYLNLHTTGSSLSATLREAWTKETPKAQPQNDTLAPTSTHLLPLGTFFFFFFKPAHYEKKQDKNQLTDKTSLFWLVDYSHSLRMNLDVG